MGRMLAALQRLETESSSSPCAIAPLESESVAITQVVRVPFPAATSSAGCLSKNTFWQPFEMPAQEPTGTITLEQPLDIEQSFDVLETLVADEQIATTPTPIVEPVAIDVAPEAVPINPVESDDPKSDILRNLATTLLRKLPSGLPAAIWVTSVGDAADASRLVADLSRYLCEDESLRVLAIDAQCGRTAQRIECGLIQALENPAMLLDAIRTTAVDGLSMLPGGVGTVARARSAEWSLQPLLEQSGHDFDLVLIDGGRATNPTTLPMAATCDGVVVFVRLGETDARDARRLVKSLRRTGAKPLGCVLAGAALGD